MNKQQQGYGYGHGDSPYCCFHPGELVVGVCPHCLKARLLLLAAKDKDGNSNPAPPLLRRRSRSRTDTTSSGSSISLPKVFALGSSFLQRLDSRGHYTHRTDTDAAAPNPNDGNCSDDTTTSVASLDDSFISIKFEDNGKATWDDSLHKHQQQVVIATTKTKTKTNKQQAAPATRSSSSSSTVVMMVPEHAKRGGVTRWRKQVVGRLLQLARWKRSTAATATASHHVGLDGKTKQDGSSRARGRAGWIRSLTRRRAAAAHGHGDRAWS